MTAAMFVGSERKHVADESDSFRLAIQAFYADAFAAPDLTSSEEDEDGSEEDDLLELDSCGRRERAAAASSPGSLVKRSSSWNLAAAETGDYPGQMATRGVGGGVRRSVSARSLALSPFASVAPRRAISCENLSVESASHRPSQSNSARASQSYSARSSQSYAAFAGHAVGLGGQNDDRGAAAPRCGGPWEVDQFHALKAAINAYFGDVEAINAPAHRRSYDKAGKGGLSGAEYAAAVQTHGANHLPAELPHVQATTCRAAACVRRFRPAAMVTAALAAAHLAAGSLMQYALESTSRKPRWMLLSTAALGVSVSIVSTNRLLERYMSAFERLREHVRLYQYALHRFWKGEEEEELVSVTRAGVQSWVPCSSLVPGDVLHLSEGRVPADCMLVSASNLELSCPIARTHLECSSPSRTPLFGVLLRLCPRAPWWSWDAWGTLAVAEERPLKLPSPSSAHANACGHALVGTRGCQPQLLPQPLHLREASSASATCFPASVEAEGTSRRSSDGGATGATVGSMALATSIVLSGSGTGIVSRTGTNGHAFRLLLRLSSLSLSEVLFLMLLGGGVHIHNIQN